MNLGDLRENYTKGGIRIAEMNLCPFEQFEEWITVAHESSIPDANAMNLATANLQGVVTSRTVLLKGLEDKRFQFFTNYNSKKAQDLAENPNASLTFHWKELERQITIRGTVKKTCRQTSRDYFATRPYESQVGAWVSERQSKRIGVRSTLEKLDQEMRLKFPEDKTVPCPDFWGGFQLKPTYIEFWQGRQGRLHDRLRYIRHQDDWELERLSP